MTASLSPRMFPRIVRRSLAGALLAGGLLSCGGGGGGAPPYPPQAQHAQMCAAPRTGTDPITGLAYTDRPGSLLDEQTWISSWIHDWYLWYREVNYVSPATYTTAISYFNVLKTTAVTASAKSKDRFHFTEQTSAWEAYSRAGTQAGYGATWFLVSPTPPRQAVVAYTVPNSPATLLSPPLVRGTQVLFVDGIDLVNAPSQAEVDLINAGMFPATVGEIHQFIVTDPVNGQHTVTLTSANVPAVPVQFTQVVAPGVGYMFFSDNVATAESSLRNSIQTLKTAGVTDLVLDLRYNLGGYVDIAGELAYMIAAPALTTGKYFELEKFNDKYPTMNPVNGGAITPVPFWNTTLGIDPSLAAGTTLPTLGLHRVFVLTGHETYSASESIINGLRGVGVQVIEIGSTTGGKPYGFYPKDNCGTTYFSIQFQGVNQAGFGDYPDGFSPQNSTLAIPGGPATLDGCQVGDDFIHALGSTSESQLAAALAWKVVGSNAACPAPTGYATPGRMQSLAAASGTIPAPEFRRARILRSR